MKALEGVLSLFGITTLIIIFGTACCDVIRHTTIFAHPKDAVKYHYSVAMAKTTAGPLGSIKKSATAWAVDNDHMMTAGHFCDSVEAGVKEGKAGPFITLIQAGSDGNPLDTIDATILANSKDNDMCILSAPAHFWTPLVISNNFHLVQTEDPVVVVGAPHGFFPIRREGWVSSISAHEFSMHKDKLMLLSLLVEPGSSGSPIIWGNEVIGMVVRLPYKIHETCLAVRAPDLLEFIEKHID